MNEAKARDNIVMLMAFTVIFAVIGEEIKANQTQSPNKPNPGAFSGPVKVFLGGAVAGTLLIAIAHAGDAGAQFATGLAMISAATAILVDGGPVWTYLAKTGGGSAPPTAPSVSTAPTPSTTPTGG